MKSIKFMTLETNWTYTLVCTCDHHVHTRRHLAGTGDEPHHELEGEPAHVDALYHGEHLVPLVNVLQPARKLYSHR